MTDELARRLETHLCVSRPVADWLLEHLKQSELQALERDDAGYWRTRQIGADALRRISLEMRYGK